MASKLVIFSALLVTALAGSVPFKDCGSKGSTIHLLDVGGCSAEPCHLVRGEYTAVVVNFTASEDVTHPTNSVYGIFAGIPVRFPSPVDCCGSKVLVCPIKSGTSAQYDVGFPIAPSLPKIEVLVKLSIFDDEKNDFLCLVFSAVIVDH